jgi:hypothetical protein
MKRHQSIAAASAAVAWLALLGALAEPFDGVAGRFDAAAVFKLTGQTVAVPQNFNAQFERYQFVLQGARPVPEATQAKDQLPNRVILGANLAAAKSSGYQVLSSRLVLRSRHNPNEVTWSALSSRAGVQQLLVEREYLMQASRPD